MGIIKELLTSLQSEAFVRRSFSDVSDLSQYMLKKILQKAQYTSFGRRFQLTPQMSVGEFQKAVPIHTYKMYEPWVQRIIAGEKNILWPGRPISYVTTSGTTQGSKMIPITSDFLRDYHLGSRITFHRVFLKHPGFMLGRILPLGGPVQEKSEGNLPTGSITGLLYSTLPSLIRSRLAIPITAFNVPSYDEKLYIIARLALTSSLTGMISVTPGSLLVLAEEISNHSERYIQEIEKGEFRQLSSVSSNLQTVIQSMIRPDPKRAEKLRNALSKDKKIYPKNIWPLQLICTYLKEIHPAQMDSIRKYYGKVEFIDPGLVASEGRVSAGIELGSSSSLVIPCNSIKQFSRVSTCRTIRFIPDNQCGNISDS